MKVIIGTSIVSTTTFIIFLFVELGILLTSFPQFVYAQTLESEIIENTLEKVEEATQEISERTNSLNNTLKLIDNNTTLINQISITTKVSIKFMNQMPSELNSKYHQLGKF